MVSVENEIFPLRKYNKFHLVVEAIAACISCAFHCFIFPERNELLNWYVQCSHFFSASSSSSSSFFLLLYPASSFSLLALRFFCTTLCRSSRFSFLLAIIFCTRPNGVFRFVFQCLCTFSFSFSLHLTNSLSRSLCE